MSTLPDLLAGPILRRSSLKSVTVWLATSKRMNDLVFEIYNAKTNAVLSNRSRKERHEIKVGRNFYVYLLRAFPLSRTGFPPDTILSYRVGQTAPAATSGVKELWDEHWEDFAYPGFRLPTFVLQKDKADTLNAMYGSCRKMHGPGTDASGAADHQMKQFANSVKDRPHALLLGGDQIYADDVPDLMMRHIQALAVDLFGYQELMPDGSNPARLKLGARSNLLKENAGFTSGLMGNHLMTFGEYCAVYLLTWNDKLWPAAYPSYKQVSVDKGTPGIGVPGIAGSLLFGPALASIKAYAPSTYKAEKQSLEEFKAGCRHAKKLLANVPTYMIFDDHEITDDWFLNPKWEKKAKGTKLGKRIIANGLAAYWLFQGIGNDLEKFYLKRKDLQDALQKHTSKLKSKSSDPDGMSGIEFWKKRSWYFVTTTKPAILFLDTRTKRHFSKIRQYESGKIKFPHASKVDINEDAPLLLKYSERKRIRQMLKQMARRDKRIIVVTPGPVFGIPAIEEVKEKASGLPIPKLAKTLDLESFTNDPNSYFDMMKMILSLKKQGVKLVMFLSGDVHYGISARGMIDSGPKKGIMVAQFCSSAIKNSPTPGQLLILNALQKRRSNSMMRFWRRHTTPDGKKGMLYVGTDEPGIDHLHPGTATAKSMMNKYIARTLTHGFRFAEIFKFDKSGLLSTAEELNNMGYFQLSKDRLHHYFMVQNPGFKKTFETTSRIHTGSWPATIDVD